MLELYVIAPAPMMAILAGMALGGMVMTLVRASVIVLAGMLLFGVSFEPTSWWGLLAVFLLAMLALYGLGMVFASAFLLWGREAWHIVTLLQEPVYLLSGLNFPIRTLPSFIATLAAVLPLTTGVDALRQILFPKTADQALFSITTEIVILVILSIIFLVLARWSLSRLEQRARQEGRLTVKWQ